MNIKKWIVVNKLQAVKDSNLKRVALKVHNLYPASPLLQKLEKSDLRVGFCLLEIFQNTKE